jgi:hypothetical protein
LISSDILKERLGSTSLLFISTYLLMLSLSVTKIEEIQEELTGGSLEKMRLH